MDKTGPSPEQQTLTLQQILDLAVQHHAAGELGKAEDIYQQILQSDPNQPIALHLLGVIAHQKGENDTAVDLITKALSIKPDFPEAHNNLGNVFTKTGQINEAVASYHKAIALNPDYAEAHNNLGFVFSELGRLNEAVASYRRAFSIKPDYAEAHYNLGIAFSKLGRLNETVASYRKALIIKPNYAEAHYNLGVVLKDLGELNKAVTSYHKALTFNPHYTEAHSNLGVALTELGRLDEAVESYHRALAIRPDFIDSHINLGIAFAELGRLDEAMASYHKALAINPEHAKAHSNLGNTLYKLGRFEDAISSYGLVQSTYSRAKTLECLYALKRYKDFYSSLGKLLAVDKNNIRAAAISAFASQQLNHTDPHPFCKEPIKFVRVYECLDVEDDQGEFLHHLIDELKSRASIWEPNGKSTKGGFQSPNNLFINPTGLLADLEQLIMDKIEHYRFEFSSEDCDYIKLMPKQFILSGWIVRLLKGGHQTEHIHAGGWLSGVFYLRVPKFTDQEEGSIEFGLWGYNYPILNKNYPRKRYYPKDGDIVLFPSSLFHRTISFHLTEERISIAFDLVPT